MPHKLSIWLSRILRFLVIIVILSASAGLSIYWMKHKPATKRGRPERKARLVDVLPLAQTSEKVAVRAMGTVIPSRKAQLSFRVAGKIIWMSPHLIPGGFLPAGEPIAKIDMHDYEIELEQKRIELAIAQADKALEMGKQAVARTEMGYLKKSLSGSNPSLVLRKPQLAKIDADIKSRRTAIQKAELDLARTSIHAPFDSIVQTKHVETGTLVSVGSPVVTVYGRNSYWIEVLVAQDDLKWIEIPGINSTKGSEVRIYNQLAWPKDQYRSGAILKMKPELDADSRMACLIIRIDDPLDLATPVNQRLPLLAGAYVKVAIQGRTIDGAVKIDRTHVHDGNTVFLMEKPANVLVIRKIEIVWSDASYVYTQSLHGGEVLVITDIGTPLIGMALRTEAMPDRRMKGQKRGALDKTWPNQKESPK